ncbi:multidrug effflux MFS transporter [Sphingomonas sp. Leaf357]|uniref:multidrug effflux MFS transporter n=1 Tax=Sphingomonas sp. Leaf357 TaxID=1736350 RepID=UPI0009E7A563|nr:multidrug effflux MFS transporter [Sphingomonas sp. Leaf357]
MSAPSSEFAPDPALASDAPQGASLHFVEFVALVAALMALGALGIDSMLPALPAIGLTLGVRDPGDFPLVITFFMIGFGLAQIVHGPLADRYGRRPVLIVALCGYVLFNALAALSHSFTLLLLARLAGGAMIASTRVVAVALVRDCYSGRAMARVSSLAFMTFMIVPVLAPSFGQIVLLLGSWRLIFWAVAAIATLVVAWFTLRMPETLADADREALSWRALARNWRITVTDRHSLGYSLATTALQGALFGYLGSIQPIMDKVFHRPALLGIAFAASAGLMAVANLLNSQIVMRVGMRRISQSALVMMILASSASLTLTLSGSETLWLFVALQAVTMASFGLAASNFSAMAMDKVGHIAGTASSVQGLVTTTGGALAGALIGRAFDGTTVPLHIGFLAGGMIALVVIAIVERGRLFRPV